MTVVSLPEEEGAILKRLRETDRRRFLLRVQALVDAGWPLRAVGEPLGTGRSTVRAWKVAAEGLDEHDEDFAGCSQIPARTRLKVARLRPDVPEEERDQLAELALSARQVNRWTAQDAPERRASQELNEKLYMYVQRGVPVRTLANRLNVTYRAVVARLERQEQRDHHSVAV